MTAESPAQPFRSALVASPGYASTYVEVTGGLAKLNHNESAFDAPEAVKAEVLRRLGAADWRRYPDPHASGLRRALSRELGHPEDGIVIGNGGNELIYRLLHALRPDTTLILCPPTYGVYERAARVNGVVAVKVPLLPGFRLDADAVLGAAAAAPHPALLLCNPGNPTGNLLDPEALARVLDGFPGLVVIDEAYFDFCGVTIASRLREARCLVVLRTLSKAHALAGVRLGWLMAHPETARELEKAAPPYPIGLFAQVAGEVAVAHAPLARVRAANVIRERDRVAGALASIPGVGVYPSAANFLLVDLGTRLPAVAAALDAAHVVVRDVSKELPGHLRLGIGTRDENDRVIAAVLGA